MKVLMVLEREFPPDERVEKEAISLIEAGHEVFLACYTMIDRKENEEYKRIKIYRKPISKFIYKSSIGCLRFPYYFNFWRNFLHRLFENETFDAIHIHDLPLVQVGLELKLKYKIPLVFDMHENYPVLLELSTHTKKPLARLLHSNKAWHKYEISMLHSADRIFVVIDEMLERVKKLGILREKISILPNTIKISDFSLPDIQPDNKFITMIYVGGINIHRGLQVILKGMRLILNQRKDVRLWIVGSGNYVPKLEKLVYELKLSKSVDFLGWKNISEIAELLMLSDIAIIPHLKTEHTDHTIPNKLYQYAYANKPIITSNCNPLERLVTEMNIGISYKHDSAEDFVDSFFEMTRRTNFNKIGMNGRKHIVKKYNWDKTVIPLLQTYQSIQKQ